MSDAPTTNAARLREFHRTIGADSPQRPTVPSPERLRLRWTLIEEEVGEVRAEVVFASTAEADAAIAAADPASPSSIGITASLNGIEIAQPRMPRARTPPMAAGRSVVVNALYR